MKTKRNQGFNLIDLLLVIAVLVVVASVTVACYKGVTHKKSQHQTRQAYEPLNEKQVEGKLALALTNELRLLPGYINLGNDWFYLPPEIMKTAIPDSLATLNAAEGFKGVATQFTISPKSLVEGADKANVLVSVSRDVQAVTDACKAVGITNGCFVYVLYAPVGRSK